MNGTIRYALIVMAVATTAAFAGYWFSGRQAAPPPAPSPTAPPAADAAARLLALELPDLEGKAQPLAAWRGKVLVVNFWATWCPPCRAEIPEFARISEAYAAKGVQFVGISMDGADKVREFKREIEVPYPSLIGSLDHMELIADLGNRTQALPFTVIVGRDGTVHRTKLGLFAGTELEKALLAALGQR